MNRVVLSAGHDPKARGACFPDPKVTPGAKPVFIEFDEASAWVKLIAAQLRRKGIDVLLVPDISFEQLEKTIEWINALKPRAALAVEVHFNDAVANGKQVGTGCESFHAPNSPRGKALCVVIQDAMAKYLGPDRGAQEGWMRRDRPGIVDYKGDHDGDEKVMGYLRLTNCPAVLIEPGFVRDHERIVAQRWPTCVAIADAIEAFLRDPTNRPREAAARSA